MSSSTALGKLRWIQRGGGGDERAAKNSLPTQQTLQDSTIPEDAAAEEESAIAGGTQRVNKSPSLPFSHHRGSVRQQKSLGMFRSVRRKPAARLGSAETSVSVGIEDAATETKAPTDASNRGSVEMREVGQELGRRSRSLKR